MELTLIEDDGLWIVEDAAAQQLLQLGPFAYHATFHQICQSRYQHDNPDAVAPSASDLDTLGFDVIRSFAAPETATAISNAYDQACAAGITKPDTSMNAANSTIPASEDLKRDILQLVMAGMSGAAEQMIENYFGSYFRIDHFQLMRTEPASELEVSFRWHRDLEPISQLHIMVYLTDSTEGDATTVFASLEDTRRCARQGYSFPKYEDRVEDIDTCLADGETPIDVTRPELAAGDATIFGAPRILHKGCPPEHRHRDVMLLNLLPSLTPWRQEIDVLGHEHLFQSRNTFFINPFARAQPAAPVAPSFMIPEWVHLSQFFGG